MTKPDNRDELTLALQRTRENVKHQARLAGLAIIVTVVLCFALTVAWYSNILHTSDLTFKAESWDFVFTGDVGLTGEDILAAPGDTGILSLSVENISNEATRLGAAAEVTTIGVTVNFDKSDMGVLRERIYFYVDHPTHINGESVEKQYVSTADSYTYKIYPGHSLVMSDTYCNDFPIKWEWVYDVVGYYVRGTLQSDGTILDPEYISPIVFDYTNATFVDHDKNSNTPKVVSTINSQNVDDFIKANYLDKDGFAGNTVEKTKDGKYYKVANDVYIYLCNEVEIKANNDIDTQFALGTSTDGYGARIILTGTKANENAYTANSSADLAANINSSHHLIELAGDMTLANDLIIEDGTNVTIDLKGHTMKVNSSIIANPGSSIGFVNGTITTDKKKTIFVKATSAEVYLDNMIINDFYSGVEIFDDNSVEDSYVHISQSTIKTLDSVVWLRGNGDKSSRKTTLIIEDSVIESKDYIPVGGNGSATIYGTDIKVISSTLTGYYGAIYHPMKNSTLLIKDSTLTGMTALAVKGGDVTIENSTIHGNGKVTDISAPTYAASGYTDTGAAIYVEDNYAIDTQSHITINIHDIAVTGNKTYIISDNADAIIVYQPDSEHVSCITFGGVYSSDVTKFLPNDGSKTVTSLPDGRYKVDNAVE